MILPNTIIIILQERFPTDSPLTSPSSTRIQGGKCTIFDLTICRTIRPKVDKTPPINPNDGMITAIKILNGTRIAVRPKKRWNIEKTARVTMEKVDTMPIIKATWILVVVTLDKASLKG
jgi:hypothetical protein